MNQQFKNKQILLTSRPVGLPTEQNFEFKEIPVANTQDGQVVVRTLYLSVDPYMRGRMSDAKSYIPPFQLNEVIAGGIVGEIVESKSDLYKVGDKVIGMLGWQLYNTVDAKTVTKIDESIAPVSAYLSVLGLTGLTAYFGLLDIGQPKEGETVVVSGAAGSVGMFVGQIAKIKGARVVGIAGTDAKCEYLKKELGIDAVINYKTAKNLGQALEEACPNGVDVYFDNVGGSISDAVMNLLNDYARIPLCGAISSYNSTDGDMGPRIQTRLIKTRSLIKGFVLSDYSARQSEGLQELGKWLTEGKLKYEETIVDGFDNVIEAFLQLFQGANLGKMLVKVSDSE
ncbi:NADP-dependent oxidoreductase [Paenibacillus crassostreae]|uniref:NADP-dependent oxidoreductase n=1 Tax=Paenibacillus crassostreae TaxID=1763538 RepID=A0A167FDX6_9BACL|nr:NADP-dependent oxidoreductase [Paenibacillus crassostreae]AOZ90782.1 NADP-dependent oxidoreductase [Paenibacillus crassostreae]OAB76451.1 NADP-dependent oxidoreductase [Paenibacillus crassostreae]